MAGLTDLTQLLAGLDPVLHEEILVWVSVPNTDDVPTVDAFARISEAEGTTLVVTAAAAAQRGLEGTFPCRRIELRVHSDLAAVGLTATVATALTLEGISANVVAGFHHDHLLVPADRADDALRTLHTLADSAR